MITPVILKRGIAIKRKTISSKQINRSARNKKKSSGYRWTFDKSFDAFYPSKHLFIQLKEDWQNECRSTLFFGASCLVRNTHEKMLTALAYAHSSVSILYDADQSEEEDRREAEKDLIDREYPPLNRQC